MDIQNFIAEFKKTFVYDLLSMTLKDEQLFEHVVDGDAVLWFKEQTRQMWLMWEKAQAQAMPEWISVKDNLPPANILVLGMSQTHNNIFNIYNVMALDEFEEADVTHWMPLPDAPQEPASD
ncbi:DUF551 domain-containing protein [Acinetobacter lwoffii]|uniref:DUF551 domain-containing protein n=1 Tax=Acinetobacter lwoffii TaxID=28090 RepID=UPI0012986811|nr:DUF551 domain-containing protein [Acinetobacter lwoffii]